jgi:hypothetical protein
VPVVGSQEILAGEPLPLQVGHAIIIASIDTLRAASIDGGSDLSGRVTVVVAFRFDRTRLRDESQVDAIRDPRHPVGRESFDVHDPTACWASRMLRAWPRPGACTASLRYRRRVHPTEYAHAALVFKGAAPVTARRAMGAGGSFAVTPTSR